MTRPTAVVSMVLCAVLAGLSGGCKSSTERAEERTMREVAAFHDRLEKMPLAIDKTMGDLSEVTQGQNPDRDHDFSRFRESLAQLNTDAREVGARYQDALADSNEFYRLWNKQARKISAEERLRIESDMNTRLASRGDAMAYFNKARTSFLNLSSSLGRIEENLQDNLSDQNVIAQGDLIQKAITDAIATRAYIDRLDETLSAAAN